RQIGRSVPFLDVFIQNNSNGALKTSVYHKAAAEPYVVPFGSDHPSHVFRSTVDTAIMRAVHYSTTLSQFEEEIQHMKLMFLYNGQPMYLTRSSSILYEILNKTLNYSLKKKDEKQFINVRLQLLDQQYCLENDRQLW
ncbi:unnamed protein product, partial [Rotaria socialis]